MDTLLIARHWCFQLGKGVTNLLRRIRSRRRQKVPCSALHSWHLSIDPPLPQKLISLKLTLNSDFSLYELLSSSSSSGHILPRSLTHLEISSRLGTRSSNAHMWSAMPRGMKIIRIWTRNLDGNLGHAEEFTADYALDLPPSLEELYTPDITFHKCIFSNLPKTLKRLCVNQISAEPMQSAKQILEVLIPGLELNYGYRPFSIRMER